MPFFGVPIRNGLPIGLGSVAGFGVQQFDPSQLFAGGTVAGAWYDPSDLSTMFTTSAGTTPVAMPGLGSAVSVGLMLDKSKGLVLGSELVTNGNFSSGTTTGWTGADAVLSVVSGQLGVTPNDNFTRTAYQSFSVTAGRTYVLQFNYNQNTATTLRYFAGTSLGSGSDIPLTVLSGSGFVTRYFTATGSTLFIQFGAFNSAGLTALFDNFTVRELPGNHAISFNDTTARPELRARVNLLERSEEFNNAYWTRNGILAFGSGSVVDATTAPDGTVTADLITETATTAVHTIARTGFSLTGSFVYSVSGKANGRFITFSIFAGNNNFAAVTFDLVGGTVTEQSSVGSQAITSAPNPVVQNNGFFRCSVTANFVGFSEIYVCLSDVGNPVALGGQAAIDGRRIYAGNGTSGAYIWGADLRPANIGANVPAYQRIADANTYDTSGFPLYLRFDGIDDSMYTPANLNLSGTDKVAVFAGVRKLSDTSSNVGNIAELSAAIGSNNGAFELYAPAFSSVANSAGFSSKGTTAGDALTTTFNTPSTAILTGLGDISGDRATLRLNGTQVAQSTNDQGAGNFGTYPLYIGSRGNTSAWFNGHLHSLIIAGSAVSAGNISATEQWVAQKTGIAI